MFVSVFFLLKFAPLVDFNLFTPAPPPHPEEVKSQALTLAWTLGLAFTAYVHFKMHSAQEYNPIPLSTRDHRAEHVFIASRGVILRTWGQHASSSPQRRGSIARDTFLDPRLGT